MGHIIARPFIWMFSKLCAFFTFYIPCDKLANWCMLAVLFFKGEHICERYWEKFEVDGELAFRCKKCGKITTLQQMYQEAGLRSKSMHYISNAFSLQMIGGRATLEVENCTLEDVQVSLTANEFEFAVGHPDTANIVAAQLNKTPDEVFQRKNIALMPGDILYVLQAMGGRLPEGCTKLPEGISLAWKRVRVK